MTEFLLCLLLATPLLFGAGAMLQAEWNRIRCAHHTFVTARKALIHAAEGRSFRDAPSDIEIQTDSEGVTAQGNCGGTRETIRLLHLERTDFQ